MKECPIRRINMSGHVTWGEINRLPVDLSEKEDLLVELFERKLAFEELMGSNATADELFSKPVRFQPHESRDIVHDCAVCGRTGALVYNPQSQDLTVVEPCLYPSGVGYDLTVSFPSGKVVVGDEVVNMTTDPEDKHPRVSPYATFNSLLGQAQHAVWNASKNNIVMVASHEFYGSVYQTGKDSYVIAQSYDLLEHEILGDGPDRSPWRPGADGEPNWLDRIKLSSAFNGFAMMDAALFVEKGGDLGFKAARRQVFEVEPGTYTFDVKSQLLEKEHVVVSDANFEVLASITKSS